MWKPFNGNPLGNLRYVRVQNELCSLYTVLPSGQQKVRVVY